MPPWWTSNDSPHSSNSARHQAQPLSDQRKHAERGAAGRPHLLFAAAHCGQTLRLTAGKPAPLTSACAEKLPGVERPPISDCAAGCHLMVDSNPTELNNVLMSSMGSQRRLPDLLPRRCLHRVQKHAELASASLRQPFQSQPYRECNGGQMERWSAPAYVFARVPATVLHWQVSAAIAIVLVCVRCRASNGAFITFCPR